MKRLGIVLFLVLSVSPALAAFHFMVIQEVFLGPPSDGVGSLTPDQRAQYVMLRMTSNGQNFVGNSFIRVEDSDGNVLGRFGTFSASVPNGGSPCSYPNCPAVIMGTQAADNLFTFSLDQVVDGQASRVALPRRGGRACFVLGTQVVDCLAWGDFDCTRTGNCKTCSNTPNQSCTVDANCGAGVCIAGVNVFRSGDTNANGCDANYGVPSAPGGLQFGRVVKRTTFNCAAKENATNFALDFPHPVNNAGNNNNSDADADGLIDVLDCDDASGAFLFPVADLRNLEFPNNALLTYSQEVASGSGVSYDVVYCTGVIGEVQGPAPCSGGAQALMCDEPSGSLAIPDIPDAGALFSYLSRASSSAMCGGTTPYGSPAPELPGLCP